MMALATICGLSGKQPIFIIKQPIEIPGGHATVFAAYGRDFDACPDRPPSLFFAFAYLEGTVTAVNFVSCPHCEQVPWGPYNSLRGMKEVVRGLRLRPEPVYPAG